MKTGLFEIVCVMDRSGSMAMTAQDAVGGFNTFLESQKKLPGDARLTLVLFNTEQKIEHDGKPIRDVEPLVAGSSYVPDGMTALLDAVAGTIDRVGKRLSETAEDEKPERVIVAIITDGHENSSKRHRLKDVAERVKRQQDDYKWEFLFLGANMDAFAEAGGMAIMPGTVRNYVPDAAGTRQAYATMDAVMSSARMAGTSVKDALGKS